MRIQSYIKNYVTYYLSLLIAGKRNYDNWNKDYYALQKTVIGNKQLAQELENECNQKGGFLTFAEYLTIEQFGKHGYHATNNYHGLTPTHTHWGKALTLFCKKKQIYNVVEFGFGNGDLGISMLKQAKKEKLPLSWDGIEINDQLANYMQKRLQKEKLNTYKNTITSSIQNISFTKPSLVVFSYSLDSIPPEIFINTQTTKAPPNTLIGITVKNNLLTETILTKEQLQKRGITIDNSMYTTSSGTSFDLSSWQLQPQQRAYIPLQAFATLFEVVQKMPKGSYLTIIDEIKPTPPSYTTMHLGIPKNLLAYQREFTTIKDIYLHPGENLFYYPFYFQTFVAFLKAMGFKTQADIEQKLVKELLEEKETLENKPYYTYAFLTDAKTENPSYPLPLAFPTPA